MKIRDPELKKELEGKDVDRLIQEGAARRARGRPKGSGTGARTRRYNISLPLDLAAYLDDQESPSATIARALQEMIARDSRR